MLRFQLEKGSEGLNLLLLGAHCDDIEIGCGGTILNLIARNRIKHVKWIVFASTPEREKEARACAEQFLDKVSSKEIVIKDFRDGFLPQMRFEIKSLFEEIKGSFNPDVIFTHYQHDLHQDHRLLSELAWNTFRNHLILEYEIPKYDGDLGNPSVFSEIGETTAEKKIKAIMQFYSTQKNKHWFDDQTFYSIMRIRGMQSACRYAEAFYARKVKL
jgi:LmbE family N-acetylglucosaminyl deacetylase